MPLFIFHCTYCGHEERKRINASPSVARVIGRRCDKCGEVWERNPVAELAVDTVTSTLGEQITPYGILDPGMARKVENLERQAVDAIRACRYHTQNTADRCDCWLQVRAFCYEVWRREGKESPIGWRADALWSLAEREQHTNHGNTVELDESPSYTGPTFSDGLTARDYTEQKLSKK
jgi:hypothetical protein